MVTPGFIDAHTHATEELISPDAKKRLLLRDVGGRALAPAAPRGFDRAEDHGPEGSRVRAAVLPTGNLADRRR